MKSITIIQPLQLKNQHDCPGSDTAAVIHDSIRFAAFMAMILSDRWRADFEVTSRPQSAYCYGPIAVRLRLVKLRR